MSHIQLLSQTGAAEDAIRKLSGGHYREWAESLLRSMQPSSQKEWRELLDDVLSAARTLRRVLRHTPLEDDRDLSEITSSSEELDSIVMAYLEDGVGELWIFEVIQNLAKHTNQLESRMKVIRVASSSKSPSLAIHLAASLPVGSPARREILRRVAKFPKGVSMTVDEVADVVGPEFKEMNENPPPEVVAVREQMGKKGGFIQMPTGFVAAEGAIERLSGGHYLPWATQLSKNGKIGPQREWFELVDGLNSSARTLASALRGTQFADFLAHKSLQKEVLVVDNLVVDPTINNVRKILASLKKIEKLALVLVSEIQKSV